MKDKNDNTEKRNKMMIQSIKYRGAVIDTMVITETLIEVAISKYFCGENFKQVEMLHSLLSTERITFSHKAGILSFIIKAHYTDFFNKHLSLLDDLDEMIKVRNIMAHRKHLITKYIDQFNGETIFFESWTAKGKNLKVVPFPMDNKEMLRLANKVSKINAALDELCDTIEPKPKEK